MLKKTTLLISCLIFVFTNFTLAQNINVTTGNLSSENYFVDYFGADEKYIYTYDLVDTKGKISSIEIKKFNISDLNLDTTNKIILNAYKNDFPTFFDIKLIHNTYYIFATLFHRLNNDHKLILYQFNLDGTQKKSPIEISSKKVENHRVIGEYEFKKSEVTNTFFITYQNLLNKTYSKGLGVTLVNIENKEKVSVFDTLITSNYINKNINILEAIYSKDSTFHILTNTNTSKTTNSYSNLNHKYTFFSYYLNDKMLKEYPIDIGSNWINSATFILNNNQDPVISGFYSNSRRYAFVGSFYISLNNQKRKIIDVNMKELHDDLFTDKQKQTNKKELKEIYFEKMYQDSSGYYSICQESYIDVNSYVDPQTRVVTYDYYYYYLDIIIVKFDLNGNYIYEKRFPKNQITINDEGIYSSYLSIMKDHKIYFIYNDHVDNFENRNEKSMSQPKSAHAVIEEFNTESSNFKEIVINNKQEKRIIIPSSYYILPNKDIIITTEKLNNSGIIKLQLN